MRDRKAGWRGDDGFTLIEIMVVVFILGLLVALVGPNVVGQGEVARHRTAKVQVANYAEAVRLFHLDNGRYPDNTEGLSALVPPPPADLPYYNPDGYVRKSPTTDPWHRPYIYQRSGRSFAVISYGADGRPGGDGYDADIDSRNI